MAHSRGPYILPRSAVMRSPPGDPAPYSGTLTFPPSYTTAAENATLSLGPSGIRECASVSGGTQAALAKRSVTFGYGERPVLHDFSMTERQGEQVTLVGRTGAGKSTVFKLLLVLYQPQAGSITIGGVDAAAIRALPEGYATVCTDGMFSQGEWQLLSIARAAAADPVVLLLDEITADLDAATEARVLEALRHASRGRTVLSVSHRTYESLGGRTVEIKAQ